MVGPVNAKLYHEQVRGLFSSGSASATTSPLHYMEKMATSTQQLLQEQSSSNTLIAKRLDEHSKLLKKLIKTSDGGLGITDLIVARYLPRVLSRILGIGGALGASVSGILLGSKGAITGIMSRGVGMLKKGVGNIFKIGENIVAQTSKFLMNGMRIVTNVAKPLVNMVSKMGTFLFGSGGVVKTAVNLGSRMAKLAPLLARGMSKLFLPLTALMGIIDGVSGFMNANRDLAGPRGKVNIFRKLEYARSTIIDKLLLGLPSAITSRLNNGRGFGQTVDDVWARLGREYKRMGNSLVDGVTRAYSTSMQGLQDIWAKLPSRDDWTNLGTEIRNTIFGIGGQITSGIKSMMDDIKNWFNDIFSWRPWSTKPEQTSGAAPTAVSRLNRPRNSGRALDSTITTGRGNFRNRPMPQPGGSNTAVTLPRRPISLTPPSAAAPQFNNAMRRLSPAAQEAMERVPSGVKDIVRNGASALISTGVAATQSATQAVQNAYESGSELGAMIAEGATQTIQEIMSKDKTITAMFGKMAGVAERKMASMMDGLRTGMPALQDILTGNAQSGDGGGYANSGPGNWSAPDTTGYPSTSSPSPSGVSPSGGPTAPAPSWWSPEFVGPLGRSPGRGSLPPGVVGHSVGEAATSSSTSIASGLMNDMIKAGASPKLAGAIVGNMYQENGRRDKFSTTELGDNGSAIGLMQWRGVRRKNLNKFAQEHGLDPNSRAAQSRFAVEETNPNSPYADYGSVKARKLIEGDSNMSVGDAAKTFSTLAERPNPRYAHNDTRAKAAKQFFDEHQAGVSTATPKEAYSNQPNEKYRVGNVQEVQKEQARIRKMPITDTLKSQMEDTILRTLGPGYAAKVFSGGQKSNRPGEGTGSTRHNGGKAADTYIYGPDGKMVSEMQYAKVAQAWLAEKRGGIGFRMKGGGMHIDEHKDRARFWKYGKNPSKEAQKLINEGLAGAAPNFAMTKEQAAAYLATEKGKKTITEGKSALSDHPMFGSLDKDRSPRSKPSAPTSTSMLGSNRRTLQSRGLTKEAMTNNTYSFGYENLFARNAPPAAAKEPSIAMRPPDRPKSLTPQTAIKSTAAESKKPMTPSDPGIQPKMSSMPSIESIPVLDELKMLTTNSEMLN